ncbi:hypothetical protein [Arthrobacter sp. Y-9]|uniref:hypothetical protein n=1 Tax=Arthrobacter sp. Y-9 TaxID=3039385 RepID=UPI00241D5750|nr:hypothetical protein [Arthrobacter sp. Y-9]WFR83409.1 hypothetical protein P9849_12710 [Arthrobacter sp. Y-9]
MSIPYELTPYVPFGMALAGAVILFLLLRRMVSAGPHGATQATAARHSLTVGVLGWMASSLAGASTFWEIQQAQFSPAPAPWMLFVPVLLVLGIHALGQWSYPGGRRSVRVADIQPRRLIDFLPKPLTTVTALVFLISQLMILATLGFAGMAPREDPSPYAVPNPGRLPGVEVAAWLGGAWLALAAGTVAVLLLITHRHQLPGLTRRENSYLRTLSMNRLLRTSATIASGLGAIGAGFAGMKVPGFGTDSWIEPGAAFNVLVLLVMWRWPIPFFRPVSDPQPADPALRWHRLAVVPAVPFGLVTLLVLVPSFAVFGAGLHSIVIVLTAGVLFLFWVLWCTGKILQDPRIAQDPPAAQTHPASPTHLAAHPVSLPFPRASTLTVAALCTITVLVALASVLWNVASTEGDHSEIAVPAIIACGLGSLLIIVLTLLTGRRIAIRTLTSVLPATIRLDREAVTQERWQRLTLWSGAILLCASAFLLFQIRLPMEVTGRTAEGGVTTAILGFAQLAGTVLILLAVLLWSLSAVDPVPEPEDAVHVPEPHHV